MLGTLWINAMHNRSSVYCAHFNAGGIPVNLAKYKKHRARDNGDRNANDYDRSYDLILNVKCFPIGNGKRSNREESISNKV